MAEVGAPALELDANEVAATPLLGYRLVKAGEPADDGTAQHVRELRVSQPWIEIENKPITIDVEMFNVRRPLASLLVEGSGASWTVPTLSDALADFGNRWTISSKLRDQAQSFTWETLVVVGGDAEALVWRHGMAVGAHETLATTLKLLVADFSATARQTYVYSKPQLLMSALGILPDWVKSLYVPQASSFVEQARHELAAEQHKVTAERQERLSKHARPKFKIKPAPDKP